MIKFYQVKSHFFELEKSYSFVIYLYDHERDQRIVAIYPETVCTREMKDEWENYESKGAYLQISVEDKDPFLSETDIDEKTILDLNSFYFKMANKQERRVKENTALVENEFHLREVIKECSEKDSLKPLIDRVKAEILLLPLTKSLSISMTTNLVEKLFVRDIIPVRIATFAYIIAKLNNIKDENVLCDIIMASLIKDLGLGLINVKDLEKREKWILNEDYEKYPMLSIYVLSKTAFEVPKSIKRFLLEQHEQYDGSGFPRHKKDDFIDFGSYIINLSAQIVYYQAGRIKGQTIPLIQAIETFHKQLAMEGLNLSFPKHLLDSLSGFIFFKD